MCSFAAYGKLEGDTIVTTCTKSNAPDLAAVGAPSRDSIAFLDDEQLQPWMKKGRASRFARCGSA